ncbi:MAG: nucleotide exchange factor GrpE [Acidimicrobiaceae bacterium]|nr:nucleotide exchange factor GrpE [Acidimicrobiaceae bacterium]MBA4810977.1 nucleotide exchange factor GrpE [Acidimicrobiales bacterium]|tara:strand:+ start:3886 stop:4401 length:516 start_codon:yes stop_codon:yes gene_type:complete
MSDDAPVSEDDEGELNEVDPELIETIEEIDSDLIKLQEENASVIADMQRIKADFDNYRRQTAKRQVDLLEQAASSLVEKLLPALDACDAAIQQGAEDIIPVRNALVETLEDEGLEVVAHKEVEFDPERHEAVLHEAADDREITVVAEIMRSGYIWKGRTIRPAMVRTIGPS